ncbi:MAG TPA: rhodanese-like domain-containing protein [Hyphomicrobiaceae bacterium]|nr:rhodanese-like domain-containing protein [Hyphomicrobiaceae bacterium]
MTASSTSRRAKILVSTEELAGMLGDPSLRIFDCTVHLHASADNSTYRAEPGRADYDAGHIPGSAFLDLQVDLCDSAKLPIKFVVPTADAFAAGAGRLGIGEGTRVVLYDRTRNQWAARVWWMLRMFGFDDVRVLDGGMVKWAKEGRPVAREATRYPAARFIARPRSGMIVSKEEVLTAVETRQPGLTVLNALTSEQHRGAGGVHYGRPGRIPGSACVAARAIIDPETQAYLPDEQLRAMFAAAGALEADRVIAYCGGGIAASSAALALTFLGQDNVAIYTNSLQEWALDPNLPMEVG